MRHKKYMYIKNKKQATRLLCQLSAAAGRERERKEAAEQAARNRGKGNRKSLLDANARFALVDAQEAAAIEQIAWPPGRQSPDSRPLSPTLLPPPATTPLWSCVVGVRN